MWYNSLLFFSYRYQSLLSQNSGVFKLTEQYTVDQYMNLLPEWPAHGLRAQPPASCVSSSNSVLLSNHVRSPPNLRAASFLCVGSGQKTCRFKLSAFYHNPTEERKLSSHPISSTIPLRMITWSEGELSYLIQDSSSSRSLKNWCRRWDSLSLARRPAAMLLIFVKRPLTASRLSFTCDVSNALLAIRLSAWPFRSFRRSCREQKGGQRVSLWLWIYECIFRFYSNSFCNQLVDQLLRWVFCDE